MHLNLLRSSTLLALALVATALPADARERGNSQRAGSASDGHSPSSHVDDDGRGKGNSQGRGGNNGRHSVDISPWGLGYSYQGRGFGISVGPVGGGVVDGWRGDQAPAWSGTDWMHGGYGGPVFVPGPVIDPWMASPGYYGAPGSLPADAHSTYYRPRSVTSTGGLPGQGWSSGYPGPVPGSVPYEATRNPFSATPAGLLPAAAAWADESLAAFAAGDYHAASRAAVHALVETPDHGWLLLYAAQCHFAVQDHTSAANLVVSALDRLPPEAWGQVVARFRDYYHRNDYVTHVAALEQRVNSGASLPAERSLLGYHYLFLGHPDAARTQFDLALQLDPADALAGRLLPLAVPAVAAPAPSGIAVPEATTSRGQLPAGEPEELVPPAG